MSWRQQQRSIGLWAGGFGCVGMAAALGGTCHGWAFQLGYSRLVFLWSLMLYGLVLGSLFSLLGSIFSSLASPYRYGLAAGAKSIAVWILLSHRPSFTIAAADYGLTLAIVLVLQLYRFPQQPTAARWLIAGVLISGLGIAILASPIPLPAHLTTADLYHLIQLLGLGCLYQGAAQLKDYSARS